MHAKGVPVRSAIALLVLLGIQPSHVLGCLIGVNLLLDLLPMRTHIGPGVG
jgi:hypothetical protein